MLIQKHNYRDLTKPNKVFTIQEAIRFQIEYHCSTDETINELVQCNAWLVALLVERGVITEEDVVKKYPQFEIDE